MSLDEKKMERMEREIDLLRFRQDILAGDILGMNEGIPRKDDDVGGTLTGSIPEDRTWPGRETVRLERYDSLVVDLFYEGAHIAVDPVAIAASTKYWLAVKVDADGTADYALASGAAWPETAGYLIFKLAEFDEDKVGTAYRYCFDQELEGESETERVLRFAQVVVERKPEVSEPPEPTVDTTWPGHEEWDVSEYSQVAVGAYYEGAFSDLTPVALEVGKKYWVKALVSPEGSGHIVLESGAAWPEDADYLVFKLMEVDGDGMAKAYRYSFIETIESPPSFGIRFASISLRRGMDGADGEDGADGREVELRRDDESAYGTHDIQWRYVGDEVWTPLATILDGTNGENGTNGTDGKEVELRQNTDDADYLWIEWRYADQEPEDAWKTLFKKAWADLKGEKGDKGEPGDPAMDTTWPGHETVDLSEYDRIDVSVRHLGVVAYLSAVVGAGDWSVLVDLDHAGDGNYIDQVQDALELTNSPPAVAPAGTLIYPLCSIDGDGNVTAYRYGWIDTQTPDEKHLRFEQIVTPDEATGFVKIWKGAVNAVPLGWIVDSDFEGRLPVGYKAEDENYGTQAAQIGSASHQHGAAGGHDHYGSAWIQVQPQSPAQDEPWPSGVTNADTSLSIEDHQHPAEDVILPSVVVAFLVRVTLIERPE